MRFGKLGKPSLGFVFALLYALLGAWSSQADELTLYIIKPDVTLAWQSPAKLMLSLRAAQKSKYGAPVGHVAVEAHCSAVGEGTERLPERSFLDGMGMKDVGQITAALERGLGFGVLLEDYDGAAHGEGYRARIQEYGCDPGAFDEGGHPRLSFLTMKISPATCRRILEYYDGYRARGLDRVYGGLNTHPLHGEKRGAGCSSFAISVLEVAGLYDPDLDRAWTRSFRIPQTIIGTPERKVSAMEVVLKGRRWADASSPGVDVHVQDPAIMYDWVREKIRDRDPRFTRIEFCGRREGVMVDMTGVPTPGVPIWENPTL